MGYVDHQAVIITGDDMDAWGDGVLPVIEEFRASLPEHQQQLLLGPAPGANYSVSYALLPHGHSEWAECAREAPDIRNRLVALARAEGYDVVHLKFGGDDDITNILYTSDPEVTAPGRMPGSRYPDPDSVVREGEALLLVDELTRSYADGTNRSLETLRQMHRLIVNGLLDRWHSDLLAMIEEVAWRERDPDDPALIQQVEASILNPKYREHLERYVNKGPTKDS